MVVCRDAAVAGRPPYLLFTFDFTFPSPHHLKLALGNIVKVAVEGLTILCQDLGLGRGKRELGREKKGPEFLVDEWRE
jgi:hypothetical protein